MGSDWELPIDVVSFLGSSPLFSCSGPVISTPVKDGPRSRQAQGGDSESLTTTAHAPRAIPNLWFKARGGPAPLSPPRDQGSHSTSFHARPRPGQSRSHRSHPQGVPRVPTAKGPGSHSASPNLKTQHPKLRGDMEGSCRSTLDIVNLWTLSALRSRSETQLS